MSLFEYDSTRRPGTEVAAFVGASQPLTMSSLEIADLVKSRHDSVKRAIERCVYAQVIVQPPMVDEQGFDAMGRPRTTSVYRLDKRSSLVVVAQLSPVFTARIVDRWQELESQEAQAAKPFDLNDPSQLRGILLSYTEKVESLQKRVDDLLPSEAALNRIAAADGSLCVTDAAKALQIRPKALFDYLRGNGWIYRRAGASHDVGYQSRVIDGTLEHKVTTVLRPDGSERVTEQVRITPKGLAKLAKLIPGAASLAR